MKKFLVLLCTVLLMVSTVKAEEKVKVYMFEAGGCPYCEAEEEYLTGLEGYGTKFELIKKELYVDHVDWAQGKDYELGKSVAEAFIAKGYEDASYSGTPFVIISDIYAVAGYDTNLEDIIDYAYEEGDKDVVGCIQSGKTDCIRNGVNVHGKTVVEEESSKSGIVLAIVGFIAFIGAIIYVFKAKKN